MSLYDHPKEYAKETFMSLDQAEIRCRHYKKMQEKRHKAKKCPTCGKHTLQIEDGSYEEGITAYVYCENDEVPYVDEEGDTCFTDCEFTSEITEQYEPISHWYDFDEVLAFSMEVEEEGIKKIEERIGCTWTEFVEGSNKELTA
jgi:carboxypeptidase C (cathepsin A)